VGDHEHRAPRVAGLDGFEGGPRARRHVAETLALRELEASDIGHPGVEGRRVEGTDLLGGEALPPAHREFAKRGHGDCLEPMRPGQDLRGPARAREIAGVGGGQLHAGETARKRGRLPLSARRERHVEVSDEASRLRPHHAAVADEIDGGGHLDQVHVNERRGRDQRRHLSDLHRPSESVAGEAPHPRHEKDGPEQHGGEGETQDEPAPRAEGGRR
jgi:hypothetical protein